MELADEWARFPNMSMEEDEFFNQSPNHRITQSPDNPMTP